MGLRGKNEVTTPTEGKQLIGKRTRTKIKHLIVNWTISRAILVEGKLFYNKKCNYSGMLVKNTKNKI